MSRDFTKNTANYMRTPTGGVGDVLNGAAAFSWHCWAYFDTLDTGAADNRLCHFLVDSTTGSGFIACISAGNTLRIYARSQSGDSLQSATGGSISTGQWYALGGVVDIANDAIRVYVNGSQVANTSVTFGAATYTDGTPSANDAIGGAVPAQHSTNNQVDGRIAEMTIWTRDIGTQGFVSLANRVSTIKVPGPGIYLPLLGVGSPEPDYTGQGAIGTIAGTVAQANHPPIAPLFGFDNIIPFPTAVAGGGLSIPIAAYHYNHNVGSNL